MPDEIAKLPSHHPLAGKGLTHGQICQSCRGWGRMFGLANTSWQCTICQGGVRSERLEAEMLQRFAAQRLHHTGDDHEPRSTE